MINKELISFFFKKFNLDNINYEFDDNDNKSFASYNHSENKIIFRLNFFNLEWQRLVSSKTEFSLKEFVEMVLLHELGHYHDPDIDKLDSLKKELINKLRNADNLVDLELIIAELKYLILKSEFTAWNYTLLNYSYDNDKIKSYMEESIQLYEEYIDSIHIGYKNAITSNRDN